MSAETLWTWLLFGFELIGVAGTLIVGQRRLWWGWLIILAHSIPWFVYSIVYNKPGFIAMCGLWWTVNLANAMKWRSERVKNETHV